MEFCCSGNCCHLDNILIGCHGSYRTDLVHVDVLMDPDLKERDLDFPYRTSCRCSHGSWFLRIFLDKVERDISCSIYSWFNLFYTASIPDSVKAELLQRIRAFLASADIWWGCSLAVGQLSNARTAEIFFFFVFE